MAAVAVLVVAAIIVALTGVAVKTTALGNDGAQETVPFSILPVTPDISTTSTTSAENLGHSTALPSVSASPVSTVNPETTTTSMVDSTTPSAPGVTVAGEAIVR